MKNYVMAFTMLLSIVALSACNNNDNAPADEELSAETVDLVNESASTDMIDEAVDADVNEAIASSEQQGSSLKSASTDSTDCFTLTVSPNDGTFPRTITVDYGDSCVSMTGLTRSGSIVITITDTLRNPGASYTVAFNNYTVEGFSISGSKSVENTGTKDAPEYTETTNFDLTTANGVVISKTKTGTRQQIEGIDTPALVDDVFLLTGSGEVSSSVGRSYSYTITEPLKVARSCENILEGVMEITWTGKDEPVTIDYGDGYCDRKVYVSRARRIVRRAVYLNQF
ncbi:hypothetical protein SD074_14110 [Prolixibacter sp. SD074]|nr:hypothetical protein SD074_14110 [Prolixibacter sp. SD074]